MLKSGVNKKTILNHLGIDHKIYKQTLNGNADLGDLADKLFGFLKNQGFQRPVVFGAGTTGKTIKKILGSLCLDVVDSLSIDKLKYLDCDCIVLGCARRHYEEVQKTILRIRPDFETKIILVFKGPCEIKIDCVFETQPRSGTHYVIRNLMACLGLGYASVFNVPIDTRSFLKTSDDLLFFLPDYKKYLVKTHFFDPLVYPQYRYTTTVFQISYLFDAYYSFAKLISKQKNNYFYTHIKQVIYQKKRFIDISILNHYRERWATDLSRDTL